MSNKPKLAVWKFSSCDGCQLSLLDCEDELLTIAGAVDIAYFVEASREVIPGPYTISLVEGSVTTPHEKEMIQHIREISEVVITIGACATSGGIQSLKNFANVDDYINTVYAHPEYIKTLETSTAIADHIKVDFELRGCPISKYQLLEVVNAFLNKRKPNIPTYSVCVECKRRGTPCIMVSEGKACIGPVTQAGCNAICPSINRGCFGCYGPCESPNTDSLATWMLENKIADKAELVRLFRNFNADAPAFKEASKKYDD